VISVTILLRRRNCIPPLLVSSRPVSEGLHGCLQRLTHRFQEQRQVVLSLLNLNYSDGSAKEQLMISSNPQCQLASFLAALSLFEAGPPEQDASLLPDEGHCLQSLYLNQPTFVEVYLFSLAPFLNYILRSWISFKKE
jgi:hypothetical protein